MNIGDKINEIIQGIIAMMYTWFVEPFASLRSFKDLIYGKDGDVDLAFGIFSSNEMKYIYEPGVQAFSVLAAFIILIAIIIWGMRYASSGINPNSRTRAIEFIFDISIVGVLFANIDIIYQLIFGLNYSIVELFSNNSKELIEMKKELEPGPGVLGNLFIYLCLLGLGIWANFYYTMRKVSIMLFIIMGPLMLALYLIPATRNITFGWFKELLGTVLTQAIHAALYFVMALMALSSDGLVESLILYIIFIPVSEGIRSLLGLGGQMSNGWSKAAAMMGGSALLGVGGAIKGAMNGQSIGQVLRSATGKGLQKMANGKDGPNGDEDKPKTLASNTGTDTGATSLAEKMLKSGDIMSKAGKAVFGAAGAIAGSPMGPMASMAMAQAGLTAGGVVGGLAGRGTAAGATAIANRLAAGGIAGWQKGKGIANSEKMADQQLAEKLAEDETTKWANDNYEDFMKERKERFPDADETALNNMWQSAKDEKHQEHLAKAIDSIGSIKEGSKGKANASELVHAATASLTKSWANDNKEQFMKDFDSKNPLSENASQEEKVAHKQNREKAWNNAVSQKQSDIQSAANAVATKLSNGVEAKDAFIGKEQFASELADTISKNALPVANLSQVKNAVAGVKEGNVQGHSKAADLVHSATSTLTSDWANKNKEQFMKDYDVQHPISPNASENEVSTHNQNKAQAWDQAVAQKQNSIKSAVTSVASKLSNGAPLENAIVGKEPFTNELAQTVSDNNQMAKVQSAVANVQEVNPLQGKANASALVKTVTTSLTNGWANDNKEQFMKDYDVQHPLSPNASSNEISAHAQNKAQAWDQAVSKKQSSIQNVATNVASQLSGGGNLVDSYISKEQFANSLANSTVPQPNTGNNDISPRNTFAQVKSAVSGIKEAQLYQGKTVNSPLLTQQLASLKTASDKETFMANNLANNIPRAQAEKNWATTEPSQYRKNLSEISGNMQQFIPLKQSVISNGALRGVAAVSGAAVAFAGEATGVTPVSQFLADTKVGQGVQNFATNVVPAVKSVPQGSGFTGKFVKPVIQTAQNSIEYGKGYVSENIVPNQAGFRDAIAYTGGILGGVSGYQGSAKLAMKMNPYSKAVNQQTAEVADIMQMAQTEVDSFGNKVISPGAVKLVTTGNQSYIQVRDKTGQTRVVSRQGTGDSSLGNQIVYQDLAVQDNTVSQASAPYILDSGGGRIPLNRPINVNPNKLIANRNPESKIVSDVQSYNQQVDSQQFFVDDIGKNMSNVRMVIDRNRSYLMATDQSGNDYRVSAYGKGDARLPVDEVRTQACTVQNRRLVSTSPFVDENGEIRDEYTTSLTPRDLIPSKTNKRLEQRKQIESIRSKSLVEPL